MDASLLNGVLMAHIMCRAVAKHGSVHHSMYSVAAQAAQLEMFGPKDSDSFEGLGLAKTLADHLLGVTLV